MEFELIEWKLLQRPWEEKKYRYVEKTELKR